MRQTWKRYIALEIGMAEDSVPRIDEGTLNPYVVEPEEVQPGDKYGYKVIASIGQVDWAAYFGPTLWTDEKVAANGDKLLEEAASKLFPTLAAVRSYRR